ncbi:hypothetical protein BWZ22_15965 [Seonamhaeicola sp. S2-3]|uniref:molybdenum cofactor guanylyltransferase n=1 Tax=Seonamhaeicola sp. S2-3 TaxID=1936081 RepID=UPI000972D026|nr:molybdenum cofactor guanylyltransferase [Seonamhaeicola sp. S2-3]APY12625.1 hypothetical protein BWZ22_15965 [Seonamhaeicola sp. S2-3]
MIKNHITGIILAGGKSSRMGTDKGFLKLKDKRFIEYSIEALKPLVANILIISDDANYDIFGFTRVDDLIKNSGPVAGIYSGLKASKTKFNLVLSCDIPLIKTDVLKRLIDAVDTTSEVVQIESEGKSMPLIALYKKSTAPTFKHALLNNERRLRIVLKSLKTKNVVLGTKEHKSTVNINTPNELKTIENAHNS